MNRQLAILVFAVLGLGSSGVTIAADLLVVSQNSNQVLRYDGDTGQFLGPFTSGGGLSSPFGMELGPDGDLYVLNRASDNVARFDGVTGVFESIFASGNGLASPVDMTFGPDRHLYVAGNLSEILRFDGTTGAFIDVFASGLNAPFGLAFGADGHLYVSNGAQNEILRYDGASGEFLDIFVPRLTGGLTQPVGIVFGPDGNLYASSIPTEVLRFDGETGAFIDAFVSATYEIDNPRDILFGPDGHLYVTSIGNDVVARFDGTTGSFIDHIASGGGLNEPATMQVVDDAPTALDFDGNDDFLDYGAANIPAWEPTDDFTYEMWIKAPATEVDGMILSERNGMPGQGDSVLNVSLGFDGAVNRGSGRVAFFLRGSGSGSGASVHGTTVLADNSWHHVAVVHVGATRQMRIVVDGVLENQAIENITAPVLSSIRRIGNEGNWTTTDWGGAETDERYFDGIVDEVRIWSVARTAAEIAGGMNLLLDGSEPGLVAYWRLDEGGGQVTADSSGNANTAQLGESSAAESSDPAWTLDSSPICVFDSDLDGVHDCFDNCPTVPNSFQEDVDADSLGDVCDACSLDPFNDVDLDGMCADADNCPISFNPLQSDTDGDGWGNSCDNCVGIYNIGQEDTDSDGRGNPCDNCPNIPNSLQGDVDADGVGDDCDVCPFDTDPGQEDLDTDGEGDLCDLDDGRLVFTGIGPTFAQWQDETVYSLFNLYRGDLLTLHSSGLYTQDPLSSPNADHFCGIPNNFQLDSYVPPVGAIVHYVVSGVAGGESDIGTDSVGDLRPNDWACP